MDTGSPSGEVGNIKFTISMDKKISGEVENLVFYRAVGDGTHISMRYGDLPISGTWSNNQAKLQLSPKKWSNKSIKSGVFNFVFNSKESNIGTFDIQATGNGQKYEGKGKASIRYYKSK